MYVTLKFSLDEYLTSACIRVWEAAIRESSLPDEDVALTKEDGINMLDDDLKVWNENRRNTNLAEGSSEDSESVLQLSEGSDSVR